MDDEKEAVGHLERMFNGCLADESQFLDKSGLFQLANHLHLDKKDKNLLLSYVSDGDENEEIQVDFEEFQKGFVSFLQDNQQTLISSPIEEVSPKFVRGAKRYGRCSKPEITALDYNAKTKAVKNGSPKHNLLNTGSGRRCRVPQRQSSFKLIADMDNSPPLSRTSSVTTEDESSPPPLRDSKVEEFISDQTDSKETDIDSSFEDDSEKTSLDVEQLQEVLTKAGIGPQEYLNEEELAKVVEHVGLKEITREDYHQLFRKLDKDQDHQISLEDLLQEFTHISHNNHINTEQKSSPDTPITKFLKRQSTMNLEERILTDKANNFQCFTIIDPEHTGFAEPSLIIELWENAGVINGLNTLEEMEFNVLDKINLTDLCIALENELSKAEEGLAFRAAFITYQMELKYLRQILEQVSAEKEKLKLDLQMVSQRNVSLLEEIDDIQANLEKTANQKLQMTEKKYQDQLREMQTTLEQDKENLTSLINKYTQQIDLALQKLKEEENKTSLLKKDNGALKNEISELNNEFEDLQRIFNQQQNDLVNLTNENEQLAEAVSKEKITKEELEQSNLNERLHSKEELKILQDRVDELLSENELQKHQLEILQKEGEGSGKKAQRQGSILSDYVTKKRTGCTESPKSSDDEGESDPAESLKKRHEKQLEELKSHFEKEYKNLEQSCKLEISEVEDVFNHEKGELLECFRKEKEKMQEDLEKQKVRYFQECEIEQERLLEEQKKHLIDEFQEEKKLLEHFLHERQNFTSRLKENETIFASDDIVRQKAELELQLKLAQEEMEMRLSKERANILQKFEEEKISIEERFRLQIYDYERMFDQGVAGLKGKLHDDFFVLLQDSQEQHWNEIIHEGYNALQGKLRDDFDMLVNKHKEEMLNEMKKEQEFFTKALKEEYSKFVEEMEMERLKLVQTQDEKMAALIEAERELVVSKSHCEQLTNRNETLERALQDLQNSSRRVEGEKTDIFEEVSPNLVNKQNHKADDIRGFKKQESKISEYQKRIKELQDFLVIQSQENKEIIMAMERMHDSEIRKLQDENNMLEQMVSQMSEQLSKQERKFKRELREWAKCTNLTKDLYIENAQLMEAIKVSDERQVRIEKINYKLDKKCKALLSLIMRVCPTALK